MGAEKNYHTAEFVSGCRWRQIAPQVAEMKGRPPPGLDRRTRRKDSYAVSQRKRKRVDEVLGWMELIRGLRRRRFISIQRTSLWAYLVGAAYNPERLVRLPSGSPPVGGARSGSRQEPTLCWH